MCKDLGSLGLAFDTALVFVRVRVFIYALSCTDSEATRRSVGNVFRRPCRWAALSVGARWRRDGRKGRKEGYLGVDLVSQSRSVCFLILAIKVVRVGDSIILVSGSLI